KYLGLSICGYSQNGKIGSSETYFISIDRYSIAIGRICFGIIGRSQSEAGDHFAEFPSCDSHYLLRICQIRTRGSGINHTCFGSTSYVTGGNSASQRCAGEGDTSDSSRCKTCCSWLCNGHVQYSTTVVSISYSDTVWPSG